MIEVKPKEPLDDYLERKAADELEALAALIREEKANVLTLEQGAFYTSDFYLRVCFAASEEEDEEEDA